MDTRLYRESVTYLLVFPEGIADWQNPTAAELNGALANNPTCALNEDGTVFNLTDSDTDDTITFCQAAGSVTPTTYNAEVVFEAERSKDPTASNQANDAFALLAFPDIEYFAVKRIGKPSDAPFVANDVVSVVRVATDLPVDVAGNGENIRISNTLLQKGDIAWNVRVA